MQVLAMYLPQFHNVEENNLWWGDGFTEWTAVKGAKKLFKGHEQPRVPKNKNYYDLLNKDTMIWQSNLMKKYSVDGMCMYHYWFKDGRKILEKPAENLLEWKDVDMPFCFSWANETWARSWSNIREKNVWSNTFENKEVKIDSGILLEQKYGTQEDWKKHFEYLLPFFQDKRYIKIDGKPLFHIYKASLIPCIKDMVELWRELSKAAGLPGLYIVGSNCNASAEAVVDALLYMEPGRSIDLLIKQDNKVFDIDYETVWSTILKAKKPMKKTFLTALVGYDNTPRRGVEGVVMTGTTPQKFSRYLSELMKKSVAWNNELLFLNAWNEWGEGMYLEPDERYGCQFLEAIPYAKKESKRQVISNEGKEGDSSTYDMKELLIVREKGDKSEHYLTLLDDWMILKEKGVHLARFLKNAGFYNVGIYGFGILGRHLLREVLDDNIKVSYIVDRQRDKLHVDIPLYLPTEELPDVDAIIVAATFYYSEIAELLKEKGIKNIISLETMIREWE